MPINDLFNMLNSVDMAPTQTADDYNSPYASSNIQNYSENVLPNWEEEMANYKHQPTYYHVDAYMSPYVSNHWESGSPVIKNIFDESRLPPLSDKIDPNKIFNSDIAALRALANDQSKRIKLFDRVFVKSLTDKNKYGLTEEDVAALQALTAACNAITSINKEQINIKKNIAELRIKQNNSQPSSVSSDGLSRSNVSDIDLGRSVLDSLFESSVSLDNYNPTPPNEYSSASLDAASSMLDQIVSPSAQTQFEAMGVKPYVVVGETTADTEFQAFDSAGNIVPGYKLPTSTIDVVDLESGTAIDSFGQSYGIKRSSEI